MQFKIDNEKAFLVLELTANDKVLFHNGTDQKQHG